MSEFTEKGEGGSCQKKLALPRSLRDAGGKAQIVWDTIAKRYPKAAPLLYEMETVIDRAESLLYQLRNAPYPIGVSNSEKFSYFEEVDKKRSSSSTMESSSTCEETAEEVEEVGTRISYERIPEVEDLSKSNSSASIEEVYQVEVVNENSHEPPAMIDKSRDVPQDSRNDEREVHSDLSNVEENKKALVKTREDKSLEDWAKIVSSETAKSTKPRVTREISGGPNDRIPSRENPANSQSKKEDFVLPRNSEKKHEKKEIAPPIDNKKNEIESSTTKKIKRAEEILSPKSRVKTGAESLTHPNSSITPRMEDEKNTIEEKSSQEIFIRKMPVNILSDYASQNNKKIDFKTFQNKSKLWEVECSFIGCKAHAVGSLESTAKNDVATIILRMLAEIQMGEQGFENFVPFTDEQMKDIVALGTGGRPENAMRKLYKVCLEKNSPKPVYSVNQRNVVEGLMYFAECRALNKVGKGSGIREETAKISAAENVYTQLSLSHCSSKIIS